MWSSCTPSPSTSRCGRAISLLFLTCLWLLLASTHASTVVRSSRSTAFVSPIPENTNNNNNIDNLRIHSKQPYELPLGATYRQTMRFPVLGAQAFQISILTENTARLVISGMMTVDEVIRFTVDHRGRLLFNLSQKTLRTLERYKTRLLEAGYDPITDQPYVRVAPYVLPAVKIRMDRQ